MAFMGYFMGLAPKRKGPRELNPLSLSSLNIA